MNHLLTIDQLTQSEIHQLIQRALHFKRHTQYPTYPQQSLVTLFYENSTRTRVSFELAAKRLGMPVVNLSLQTSSESKGETVDDTFKTLCAMGFSHIVIRHAQDGLPARLANAYGQHVRVINAGDGQQNHPSQALLDLMTILEKKPNLDQLKITIIGDLRHSRVANSLQQLCAIIGVGELVLVAPSEWHPRHIHYGHITTSLADGLLGADVVIALRVQQERLMQSEQLDLTDYREQFALTKYHLTIAKPDALIMHPGPINRGIEIDSDVADGPQSAILEQVQNGVFMRMAIIEALST